MLKDFIEKFNLKNLKVIVACSWWADSIFLVTELLKFLDKKNLIVCHFNHNLRLDESQRDEQFVQEFCLKNWLAFELGEANIKEISKNEKTWIEETSRNERYKFLNKMKDKHKAKYILTAHHLDDRIETFFLNLVRWTKIKWLISIEEQNWDLLRPLLWLTKAEILEKLQKEKIDFVEDSTNQDSSFLRNNLRLNMLPLFEKINPSYKNNIWDLINYFSDLKAFIDEILAKIFREDYFEIQDFLALPSFLQKEFIRFIYEKSNRWTIGLTEGNIAEIIKFINWKGNYTEKEIKKLKMKKINGKVFIK